MITYLTALPLILYGQFVLLCERRRLMSRLEVEEDVWTDLRWSGRTARGRHSCRTSSLRRTCRLRRLEIAYRQTENSMDSGDREWRGRSEGRLNEHAMVENEGED